MFKKWLLLVIAIIMLSILAACGPGGMEQDANVSAADMPDEPSKSDLTAAIETDNSNEIDDLVEAHFPLLDVVHGDTYEAEIFATQRFTKQELVDLFSSVIQPENVSEEKDNQQIMVYPDDFVTLKHSENDENVILIEVASEEFVRNNYSPSFLQTYFTYRLLDSFLGNGWSNRRARACQTGDCYGGYTGSGYGTPSRGSGTFRGGGPGTGK
ncbi:DUF4247 domain-containing protein [Oceanobacillus kapialis]|uniref:DUF4247 domain-containing protein n=1 Tax=Oceanobacillus kapialis TaxID=481353 RepID=A0ABW5PWX7_9BACI